jgi:hypothetical protein
VNALPPPAPSSRTPSRSSPDETTSRVSGERWLS